MNLSAQKFIPTKKHTWLVNFTKKNFFKYHILSVLPKKKITKSSLSAQKYNILYGTFEKIPKNRVYLLKNCNSTTKMQYCICRLPKIKKINFIYPIIYNL
jgi:hypothetical protein